jgi:predicted MPP superfamily phosphohydrolase
MVLWVALINRSHALGIHRRWVNLITVLCVAAIMFVPLGVAAALLVQLGGQTFAARFVSAAAWGYILLCVGVCIGSTIQRLYWARHSERYSALVANHTTHVRLPGDSESLTARGWPTWLSRLPGNQVLKIRTQEKELAIPRLQGALDGLRIAHLSDLHMSGRIARAFFEHVVEEVNAAEVDLVAVTGDIVEGDKLLDWIPATMGRLRARYGVYYVLGNHDRRATEAQLKRALAEAGLIHVGGTWRQIMVSATPVVLAGNELPWYTPAADLSNCPKEGAAGRASRILLAHSPDQFRWAQANDVDLMLAGHLHGGQVRFPLLGAITSPSAHGVRYTAGVFRAGNTVMHVSRGVGSLTPLRLGCPPEIAVLKLRVGPAGCAESPAASVCGP